MEYKINFKNQFKTLSGLVYATLFCVLGILVVYYLGLDFFIIEDVLICFGVIFFLPAVFLQIEYFSINSNKTFEIDKSNKTITINKGQAIPFENIESVTIYMTPVLYRKDFISFTSFDDYQYAVIKLKDNSRFVFTFLMAYDVHAVMDELKGVSIEKKKLFFPTTLVLNN